MSDFCFIDCASCGRQTMVDIERPECTCLFCGKVARKKEVVMVNFRDMDIRARGRYIQEHLAEIVGDMQTLDDAALRAKWGFGQTTCHFLRKKHAPGTSGKSKDRRPRIAKAAVKLEKQSAPEPEGTAPLTEHDRFMMLLGYQQATREFLKIL